MLCRMHRPYASQHSYYWLHHVTFNFICLWCGKVTRIGSRPPTESLSEIRESRLLDNIPKKKKAHGKTKIFSDGNRSWESHAKSLKIPHGKVCHQNKEWTKKIRKGRSQNISKVAGTQIADRGWLSLKKFIPINFPRRLGCHNQVKEHPELKN